MGKKLFKLEGKVQHYAWGGYEFIPSWMGIENTGNKPFAEYWLGVHPLVSTTVATEKNITLKELIEHDAENMLSAKTVQQFGGLPYLLKLQDVREVLSIQVHPDKKEAELGFEKENAAGIPVDAPHRNYKDKNHKPEMAVAVSEFWLLHGFRSLNEIDALLKKYPSFKPLEEKFNGNDLQSLYRFVMEMPQHQVDEILLPVIQSEIKNNTHKKQDAGFWINRYYNNAAPTKNIDRGIFSMYLLNIVCLSPGESIFQDAGILHAYLEGYNVELMANSDNVLRGGLTPKHIDVPELLAHTKFESVQPHLIQPEKNGAENIYKAPVNDFSISTIQLAKGETFTAQSNSFEIHIILSGKAEIASAQEKLIVQKGGSYGIAAGTNYTIAASESTIIYRAFNT
jgi:mannose-6-phosphate isomerase